jgi:hypothetical protein
MFSDSIYQILHLKTLKNHAKLQKRGLLISEIPDLQVYTVKTPLIGWISIKTVFFGSKNRPIRGVPASCSSHTNNQS